MRALKGRFSRGFRYTSEAEQVKKRAEAEECPPLDRRFFRSRKTVDVLR